MKHENKTLLSELEQIIDSKMEEIKANQQVMMDNMNRLESRMNEVEADSLSSIEDQRLGNYIFSPTQNLQYKEKNIGPSQTSSRLHGDYSKKYPRPHADQ